MRIAHAVSTGRVRHFRLESAQEHFAMIKMNSLPERALDLVSQASDGLRHMVPNGAGTVKMGGDKPVRLANNRTRSTIEFFGSGSRRRASQH